ncbi:MAG: hypothetical protein ACJ8CB_29800 [Ktedonobacteraceae bacterium]
MRTPSHAKKLSRNPHQQQHSQYVRDFQQERTRESLTAEMLGTWLQVLRRFGIEAMLHFYQWTYPRKPYREITSPLTKVQVLVIMIHGLQDHYLLPDALNKRWM